MTDKLEMTDSDHKGLHGWLHRPWRWLGRSSYRRLSRELKVTGREIQFLSSRDPNSAAAWKDSAGGALKDAQHCLKPLDIEGGWTALHSARRYTVFGMSEEELHHQRIALLEESRKASGKLTPWRTASIQSILHDTHPTATQVADAMAIRDESFANQYHNIWMRGDQIRFLVLICLGCSALYLFTVMWAGPIIFRGLQDGSSLWSYRKVATALLFGLLGAALSALRGLMTSDKGMRIPERVANRFTTMARLFSGVIAGLAGYVFWAEGMIPLDTHQLQPVFSLPLIFGFVGEKLVMRVARTVGDDKS